MVWPPHTYCILPCWAHEKYPCTVRSILGLRQGQVYPDRWTPGCLAPKDTSSVVHSTWYGTSYQRTLIADTRLLGSSRRVNTHTLNLVRHMIWKTLLETKQPRKWRPKLFKLTLQQRLSCLHQEQCSDNPQPLHQLWALSWASVSFSFPTLSPSDTRLRIFKGIWKIQCFEKICRELNELDQRHAMQQEALLTRVWFWPSPMAFWNVLWDASQTLDDSFAVLCSPLGNKCGVLLTKENWLWD